MNENEVALMVKKGICSYKTKAKLASKYLYPRGIVKFLIIDGDHHMTANEYDFNDDHDQRQESPTFDALILTEQADDRMDNADYTLSTTTSFDAVSRTLRKKKQRSKEIDEVTVSILHVTFATGYSMLEILLRESPSVHAAGGTMVELTGELPSVKGEKVRMFFLLAVALVGVSCCLCLLNVISSIMEAAEPPHQPSARYRRRRLAPWQVRKNFPLGVYDGRQVNFFLPQPHHRHGSDEIDDKEVESHSLSSMDYVSSPLVRSPAVLADNTCIICLDEYVVGDTLRCLPCDHSFHSKCIAKWLTERSSTCPLCKIDLYESDDEEEVVDRDSNGLTLLSSSWNSVPPETRVAPSDQAMQQQHATTTDANTSETTDDDRGRPFGTWWRSFLRRRSSENSRAISLTLAEPLLPEANTDRSTTTHTDDPGPLVVTVNFQPTQPTEELLDPCDSLTQSP